MDKCRNVEVTKKGLEAFVVRSTEGESYTITLSSLPEGVHTDEQVLELVKIIAHINYLFSLPANQRIMEISFSAEQCGGSFEPFRARVNLPAGVVPFERVLHTLVHESGHVVFNTFQDSQRKNWSKLWQYSLGNGVAEMFDDSNYGEWNDNMGHPITAEVLEVLLGTELFAGAFVAVYLHPEQVAVFMEHPETTPDMRLLGRAAITELASVVASFHAGQVVSFMERPDTTPEMRLEVDWTDSSSVLNRYVEDSGSLIASVEMGTSAHVIEALRSEDVDTVDSALVAALHYPRSDYIPVIVERFRRTKDPLIKAMCIRVLVSSYSQMPDVIVSNISSDEIYQYALRMPEEYVSPALEYLARSGDIRVNEFLRDARPQVRKSAGNAVLQGGTPTQKGELFSLVNDPMDEIRMLAYKALLSAGNKQVPLSGPDDARWPFVEKTLNNLLVSSNSIEIAAANEVCQAFPHPLFFERIMSKLVQMEETSVDRVRCRFLYDVALAIVGQFGKTRDIVRVCEELTAEHKSGEKPITNPKALELLSMIADLK